MTETRAAYVIELPPGLEKTILQTLSFHIGRKQAISRGSLLRNVHSMGFKVSDRELRACINGLRKAGNPICSTGGLFGGYYMAEGWSELDDYINQELHPRAMDLLEQEKALRNAAQRRWGPQQGELW